MTYHKVLHIVGFLGGLDSKESIFLGWEDPLEKGMTTCSSILAWRIPWTEEPGRLQSMGSQESDMTEHFMHALNIVNHCTLLTYNIIHQLYLS